jgi:predicted 2-oxoglutarate/Fe(II)-dependent dioxygenase YbiX
MIQKYTQNIGKYIYHNDGFVYENDGKNFKNEKYRVLTFLWYLNDVSEGGETEFFGDMKIMPEAGKLILFPANWTFPHCAKTPISSDKYIITGWLFADL